ncbi:hypothetical protein C9J85_03660 [Haloferax sp. wsp5]|nr:hypothetical protein C9J85_03660 [Haloferax sp. wsp5]
MNQYHSRVPTTKASSSRGGTEQRPGRPSAQTHGERGQTGAEPWRGQGVESTTGRGPFSENR